MNPFFMFLLAILSPLVLGCTLLIPIYLGVAGAAYVIYYDKAASIHPLSDHLYNVFYMTDVYANLFSQWTEYMANMSLLHYTLPLLLLPTLGLTCSLWFTSILARKLMDIFQLGVHH